MALFFIFYDPLIHPNIDLETKFRILQFKTPIRASKDGQYTIKDRINQILDLLFSERFQEFQEIFERVQTKTYLPVLPSLGISFTACVSHDWSSLTEMEKTKFSL